MKLLSPLMLALGLGAPAQAGDLHGTRPTATLPLPDFAATSRDGTPRGPQDLRGHPTVLWFYPAAGTPV